jgi:CHASE3 domain sensor protein
MNTQLAFAFGMLAMVAIVMIVAIVVGIVKVIRIQKNEKSAQEEIGHIHRHISETERHIYQEINHLRTYFDRSSEELRRELQAYTDSRFDKYEKKIVTAAVDLINLQNNTQEAIKTKKQILKD